MSTVVSNEVKMTDKERIMSIVGGHINVVAEDLNDAYAAFGLSIKKQEDKNTIKNKENKCNRLEGSMSAFELIQGILSSELS